MSQHFQIGTVAGWACRCGRHNVDEPDLHGSTEPADRIIAQDERKNAASDPLVGLASSGGRFRILRLHTRGGLGDIFVAEDEELHRQVAVKKIREQHANQPESKTRFIREAEITGALEHPGIVPVYGLGQYADGQPFYAMRFIRGESLAAAIARFWQGGGTMSTRCLEFRQLLSRLIAVCNTMAYAHSQGVLHRDLKPDNILLGSYGETLVVDWGLAKAVGDQDTEIPRSSVPEPAVGKIDSCVTQIGRTLGTPQYMSPEQAAGLLERLTAASDVYSLGATLYQLLVGEGPFANVDGDLVLHLVQSGDFVRPRARNPRVPTALEAICVKAMAGKPRDRYRSARELADDLERWLADEVVSAYAEPWPSRVGRWARRRRSWVIGIIAGLGVLGTVVIAAVLLLLAQERQAFEEQRADRLERFAAEKSNLLTEAQAQRQTAEEQRSRAMASERLTHRYLYFSRINLADRAWQDARLDQMRELLMEQRTLRNDLMGFEWHYLWRLQQSSLLVLKGHTNVVTAVAFSPDGLHLASASQDRTLRLWNLATGQLECVFEGNPGPIQGVSFSPDGKRLASAGTDVRIWDAGARREKVFRSPLAILRGHAGLVTSVAISPDGRSLASASYDRTIMLWDLASLSRVQPAALARTLRGHRDRVNCICFSPDGRQLASAGRRSGDEARIAEVKLWDVASGRELVSLSGHTNSVNCVAFSGDGKHLATASHDRTVRVWDTGGFRHGATLVPERILKGHTDTVFGVCFSPDGKRLASSAEDRTIRIWNLVDGEELYMLRGHARSVGCVAFNHAGTQLASGSDDQSVRVWNARSSQEARTFTGHTADVNAVAICPDGRHLATASNDSTVRIWEIDTGKQIRTLQGSAAINAVVYNRDGHLVASAAQDGTILVWDAASGGLLATVKARPIRCCALAFHPDGHRLAVGTGDGVLCLWDVDRTTHVPGLAPYLLWKGHTRNITHVAFSPDGRHLASASEDGTAKVWGADTGQEILAYKKHTDAVLGLAYSPDGRRLATTSQDKSVHVWDAVTGTDIYPPLRAHAQMVTTVAFSRDGRRLATGSNDQNIKIWDAETGEEALTLRGHTDTVTSVAFSPDGSSLASVSDDGTVKVWNAAAEKLELSEKQPSR